MYSLARRVLFRLSPEVSHELSMDMLGAASRLKLLSLLSGKIPSTPCKVMGLTFPNIVGMAAGFDKDGDYIDILGQLGFGFVEVGTVTPKPQPGNPEPRLFRLPEQEALINRMGFNNKGVDYLVSKIRDRRYSGILGVNIGKNKNTPLENAVDDYLVCLRKVYPWTDYVAINLSSPNTPDLRKLQFGDALKQLLLALKKEQLYLKSVHGCYVPLAVKIAPDLSYEEIDQIAKTLLDTGIDGVIATNTTASRNMLAGIELAAEEGGLSGAPMCYMATEVIKRLAATLKEKIPIIGVGGIMTADDAITKLEAGASLVQLYTGFIYKGPRLIKRIVKQYIELSKEQGKDRMSMLTNRVLPNIADTKDKNRIEVGDQEVQDNTTASKQASTPSNVITEKSHLNASSDLVDVTRDSEKKTEIDNQPTTSPDEYEEISVVVEKAVMVGHQNDTDVDVGHERSSLLEKEDNVDDFGMNHNTLREATPPEQALCKTADDRLKSKMPTAVNRPQINEAVDSKVEAEKKEETGCVSADDNDFMPSNISLKVPSKCRVVSRATNFPQKETLNNV